MTLALAAIPDDPDRLPGWLEQRVVGGELRALVADLVAVHGAGPPADSVRDRLGAHLQTVLAGGLTALAGPLRREFARHLLLRPYHLLELQEIVLLEGGAYWDAVPRPTELLVRVARTKAALAETLAEPAGAPAPPKVRHRWPAWVAVAATAALVCVATAATTRFLAPPPAREPAWGWARAGGIPADTDRANYLDGLAAGADEWFDERPADAAALARRLSEFRRGCSALLLAPHAPLAPDARDELRQKCRGWAAKFDEYLAAVEAGRDPAAVRAEADDAVRKLADALRAEARKV